MIDSDYPVKLSARDEAVFFSHLSLMFDSGISLPKAFEVLSRSPGLTAVVIRRVLVKLESGFGLRGAFEAHKESFSPISLSLVSTGERTGSLSPCLRMAASWAEQASGFRSKVLGVLFYPALVLSVNALLSMAFLIWLVPAFSGMIDGATASALTRAVFGASALARNPFFWLTLGLVLGFAVTKMVRASGRGRVPRWLVRVPVFGSLMLEIQRARYWTVFSFLYEAGSPLLECLELAARASQSEDFLSKFESLKESIIQGEQLTEHFRRHSASYGTMLVAGMTLLGEGQLSSKFGRSLSRHFEVEVESALERIHAVLEPVLISLVAATTGLLLLGLYLPFGKLLQQILAD
jgi:type IV pilus assembly protein PilC